MADANMTPITKSDDFPTNLFMVFRQGTSWDYPWVFGYIISQKAFYTFVASNQPEGTRLVEEDVEFPFYLMHGDTRRALVHYGPDGDKFACYVPAFPTDEEVNSYNAAFGR